MPGERSGVPAFPGTALGEAVLFAPRRSPALPVPRPAADPADRRLARFVRALERTQAHGHPSGDVGIWVTRLLQDPAFRADVATRIVDRDETALVAALGALRLRVRSGTSPASGPLNAALRLVMEELPRYLRRDPGAGPSPTNGIVLVARRVDRARLGTIEVQRCIAVVTEEGGPACGAEDLAWDLGIPAVSGLGPVCNEVGSDTEVLVDGSQGRVFLDPDATVLERYGFA